MLRSLAATLVLLPSAHAASYDPAWADLAPKRVIPHASTDGTALVNAVQALQPGDQLVLAAGTYSVDAYWDIQVSGTAEAPIWITAAKDARVVITRPDEKQNVVNLGQGSPVSFLCLRGIEITGGSHGLRLGQCRDVWIDHCHIHHNGGPNLSANSADSHRLFLTRNHLHHGSGHGEGMYLGGNDASVIMSESVIALNHVHDCGGSQGDGIEVKQGSWGNLIAENHVHDTNYPCITVYGTGGKPVNIIERNLCYNSGDNVMQVQGEAIVRNNVLVNGEGAGFSSTDHQGKTLHLQVLHNTILNRGHAFRGGSWNGREGMVLANNVLYSSEQNALHYPAGSEGVLSTGNVVWGDGPKNGCVKGRGFEDFPRLRLDGTAPDATPAADARLDHADPQFLLPTDFHGRPRPQKTSGAMAP